ncbi:NUDIX domain-containing protein [Halosegnis marinus]|uniref:NUDIX domain-containing protein n=1 Tax=Halosegnis marinus TaxID=3034023 RepID=UPI003622149F
MVSSSESVRTSPQGATTSPGGRVEKFETRTEAVHRIADEELGLDVEIIESLGSFEHIYDTADVSGVNGKHYLANGFVVAATGGRLQPDDQHENLRAFVDPPTPSTITSAHTSTLRKSSPTGRSLNP